MPTWVGGGSSGRKQVASFWVGDDGSVPRELEKLWVGDLSGTPRLVWERIAQNTLTATPVAWNRIDLSWTSAAPGATYVLKRGATTIYEGTGLSKADTGLTASKLYSYTLTSSVAGNVVTATASATTPARPTTQKTVTLSPSSAGSYSVSGSRRSVAGPYYSGRYSSNWGRQRSAFMFAIPSDLRNCVSVNKVEFKVQNDHSYLGSGVTQFIAITHTQTAGSTWPGSTAHFGGRATAKDAWWSNASGDRFVDITSWSVPTTGGTVAENFRVKGAWGVCLVAPNDDIGYYSYWRAAGVQLRLTYTVYTG